MLFVSNLQEQERSRQYQKQLEDIKSQINKSGNKSAVCVNLSCRDKADPIQCIYLFVYVYFCVNTNNIFVYYFWLQIKLLDKIIQKEIKSQLNGLIQKARYIYIWDDLFMCIEGLVTTLAGILNSEWKDPGSSMENMLPFTVNWAV